MEFLRDICHKTSYYTSYYISIREYIDLLYDEKTKVHEMMVRKAIIDWAKFLPDFFFAVF
jgi:hypothetical protein